MKKVLAFILTLALTLACGAAAFAESAGFNAGLTVSEVQDDSFTVTVAQESNSVLAEKQPTLTVPCPEAWTGAAVTFNGEELENVTFDETAHSVSFTVAAAGTYTIAKPAESQGEETPGEQGSGSVPSTPAVSGDSGSSLIQPAEASTGAAVTTPASELFTDVVKDSWYEDAVSYVAEKEYFNGVTATEFAPEKTMSRAMFATVLWRIAGEPKAESETSFSDVADGRYFTEPVAWAAEEGLLFGSGGLFDPDGDITREQIVTVLYRYIKSQGGGFKGLWSFPLNFTDAGEVSDWAYEAMCWMTMNGVIDGKGEGRLDPKGSARRSEVAQIVMRFDELLKKQ